MEFAAAAALFRSLGDPVRLAFLRRLASEGPARVVDLVQALGLAQSTVSKHLACLRGCGLVSSTPAGRASVFALAQPSIIDVLGAAEGVLTATGNAVALCPTYGCVDGETGSSRDRSVASRPDRWRAADHPHSPGVAPRGGHDLSQRGRGCRRDHSGDPRLYPF